MLMDLNISNKFSHLHLIKRKTVLGIVCPLLVYPQRQKLGMEQKRNLTALAVIDGGLLRFCSIPSFWRFGQTLRYDSMTLIRFTRALVSYYNTTIYPKTYFFTTIDILE